MKALNKDLTSALQKIANENNAMLLGFIAPDKIVKTSPISYDYATISVQDLYAIEKEIDKIETPKNLHLIIHTPGGSLHVATKIAKYLRSKFENIEAYVPYEAASGGTLLCLAANIIIMGELSSLTPIDPLVPYKGQRVSCASFNQTIKELEDRFGKYSPEEIPSPHQQMCKLFDPVILKEMNKVLIDAFALAWNLLLDSQKPQNDIQKNELFDLAYDLVHNPRPHSHIIDITEANNRKFPISKDQKKLELLNTYKKWVYERLNEEIAFHVVESFVTDIQEELFKGEQKNEKSSNNQKEN